jgi:NitT/TauT family transport system permease protein
VTRARRYLPAAVAFVAVLAAWEGLLRLFNVETFVLAKPSEIAAAFVENISVIWGAGLRTLVEAVGGLVIGVVLGVVVALAAARWVPVRQGLVPIATVASAVPIIALAPIMNQWFTITSPVSKMMVVSVMVFFPVMVNTLRGLTEVDHRQVEMMHSLASTPRQILREVRVPAAMPYFFSALKVASALALIGAIVAEYFGGPQNALGQYIISRANLFQFPEAWAAIVVASLIGIGSYLAVSAIERLVMPWHVSMRTGAER